MIHVLAPQYNYGRGRGYDGTFNLANPQGEEKFKIKNLCLFFLKKVLVPFRVV